MSGTMKGSLNKKLGLKGKSKTGDMIGRMNDMKSGKFNKVSKVKKVIKKII